MSALPKSRLPEEFKILRRKPANRHEVRASRTDSIDASDERNHAHQGFVDAVHAAFGMWKDRDDMPRDGLEYERWVRGKCP
jgi:hypothetical protein